MSKITIIPDEVLLDILYDHPEGVSEYQLLQQLRSRSYRNIPRSLQDHLVLFRTHFLLFNALYRLRERLWRERRGHLSLSPLNIVLQPYRSVDAALTDTDPLRDYYLDLGRLETVTANDVAMLLKNFWYSCDASVQRRSALATLELEDPVDFATIKRQYRRLVMLHHPDRGGNKQRLQSLNLALEILKRCYRNA